MTYHFDHLSDVEQEIFEEVEPVEWEQSITLRSLIYHYIRRSL